MKYGAAEKFIVKVWDTRNFELVSMCQIYPHIEERQNLSKALVALSPDGRTLLVSEDFDDGKRNAFQGWDLKTGRREPRMQLVHSGAVVGVAFSDDGKKVCTAGGSPCQVKVWSLADPAADNGYNPE
ncbi:hypothetical protein Pla8534_07190 [Lignipirellula cremea]|uniref:WD domain, G-beta repeat n=1 Tax=Lignipirellula cremea TaxID=2528010 RepID=A0A518DM78_9BACT|nr:hypothetical protein Pla8534_07190 [Lignipirellula cremea]